MSTRIAIVLAIIVPKVTIVIIATRTISIMKFTIVIIATVIDNSNSSNNIRTIIVIRDHSQVHPHTLSLPRSLEGRRSKLHTLCKKVTEPSSGPKVRQSRASKIRMGRVGGGGGQYIQHPITMRFMRSVISHTILTWLEKALAGASDVNSLLARGFANRATEGTLCRRPGLGLQGLQGLGLQGLGFWGLGSK